MKRTALINARIFDGQDIVCEVGTVVVAGDRIERVVPGPWEGSADETVDLSGHTLTPGLIDVHTHIVGGDVLPVADYAASRRMSEGVGMQAYRTAEAARRTLLAGYTTIRDVGCRDYLDVDFRDAVKADLVPGPRVLACGLGLTPTGGHVHARAYQADGRAEIIKAVREHIRHRVDGIKIIGITGGMSTPGQHPGSAQYRYEEVEAAVQEAHRWGKRVASHAHGEEGIENAVRAGVDTLGHGLFLNAQLAELMAEHGTVFVPTLANDFHQRRLEQAGELPEAVHERRRELSLMGVEVPSIEDRMAHARAAGVIVATGSDAGGNAQVIHGTNAVEMVMLVECGYSPIEALRAATSGAAAAIGVQAETGTIVAGKSADLAAFPADPLVNIEAASPMHGGGPTYVISRGTTVLAGGEPRI
jgi:imidazolonepropionase-like amidohydrolase